MGNQNPKFINEKTFRCFKYRTSSSALRCLKNNSIYFAPYKDLNDTLEVNYNDAPPTEFIAQMEKKYSEIDGKKFQFNRENLSQFSELNNKENLRFKESLGKIGIFSTCQRPNHQALWAYYAADSTGVCFELEITKEVIIKNKLLSLFVYYDNKPRVHNRAESTNIILEQMANNNPTLSSGELIGKMDTNELYRAGLISVASVASIKHTDWAHEEEVRLISPRSGEIKILNKILKCVHFIDFENRLNKEHGDIFFQLYENYPEVEIINWTYNEKQILTPQQHTLKIMTLD